MSNINNKKINEIVGENYVHASVLYYFGIRFFEYYEKTLEQVCKEKGLNINKVIEELESVGEARRIINMFCFPIPLM